MDENTIKRVAMAIDPRAFQPQEHLFESWRAQAEEKAMKQAREAIAAVHTITEEETIKKTAEHILAKVKEMLGIHPNGAFPEEPTTTAIKQRRELYNHTWSRAMEEAARILTTSFNMSGQTREGFLNTVKTDPRWRGYEQKDFDTSAVRAKAEERRQEQADGMAGTYAHSKVESGFTLTEPALMKQAEEAVEAGEFQVVKDRPGTWTRIDTPAYKREMEEMRNKAWTEGVEHTIAILKENGYDTAAFQLGSQTIRHWRWKK